MMDKAIEATTHTDMCIGKIRDACTKVRDTRSAPATTRRCLLLHVHPRSAPSRPLLPLPFPLAVAAFADRAAPRCDQAGVGLFILADHGNCETMLTPDGEPSRSNSATGLPPAPGDHSCPTLPAHPAPRPSVRPPALVQRALARGCSPSLALWKRALRAHRDVLLSSDGQASPSRRTPPRPSRSWRRSRPTMPSSSTVRRCAEA